MSQQPLSEDVRQLITQVTAPRWGATQLAIWGGTCAEADLPALLKQWQFAVAPSNVVTTFDLPDAQMNYVILEYMDRIEFAQLRDAKATLKPNDEQWLERGRIFGVRGDLSMRRDGRVFRWHFVGAQGVMPPAPFNDPQNSYWRTNHTADFLQRDESALLWGERKPQTQVAEASAQASPPARWFEDRVARAKLAYPINQSGRVKICCWTFSRAGQVEFVWFRALRGEQEDCNG